MSSSVQILVRVRPFNEVEKSLGSNSCVKFCSERQLSLIPHSESSQFMLDGVLGCESAQEDVFEGTPSMRCCGCLRCFTPGKASPTVEEQSQKAFIAALSSEV